MRSKYARQKLKNFIFYPSKLGQNLNGVEFGPSTIIRRIIDNEKKLGKRKKSRKIWVDIKNNKCIYESLLALYSANARIRGPRVNIGGDHSMSIATVSHSLNNYENLKLIWIDAHPDINTSFSSKTKNIHGMPLGFLTNLDEDDRFPFLVNHVNFKNILYIGIRDIDDFERKILKYTNNINCNQINNWPFISKISNFIGDSPIHISFDVDAVDPKFIPCTGTSVNKGLNPDKIKILFDFLYKFKRNQIVNLDVTEFNPKIGNKEDYDESIKNIFKILDKFI
tara:strand:- start:2491 stop:3333 length:843 start_codon:yes stop_codon:yes gene_type:complete